MQINPNLMKVVSGIFSALLMASLIVMILKQFNKALDISELKLRIRSWWIMVVIFVIALFTGRISSVILFSVISILALLEYRRLINPDPADQRLYLYAFCVIPVQYFWVWERWYGMFIIFIPVYIFLFFPMARVLSGRTKDFLSSTSALHWGVMVTVFSISHAAYLLALPYDKNPNGGGAGLLLYLMILTELNDVAQYVWGKTLGHRKIVPMVSPRKTWGGFVGGVFTTTVCGYGLAGILTPIAFPYQFLPGLIIGISGFIGDIVISAVKRDKAVKDTGTLLPGHGGIMDRVDSLCYTAPLFFHFVHYLYY